MKAYRVQGTLYEGGTSSSGSISYSEHGADSSFIRIEVSDDGIGMSFVSASILPLFAFDLYVTLIVIT